MATITYRSVKGTPLTNTEIDSNFSNLNDEVATKLASADYTASDILTKIKTVDGSGSGLDADLLDGLNAVSGATGASIISRDTSGNFSLKISLANWLNVTTSRSPVSLAPQPKPTAASIRGCSPGRFFNIASGSNDDRSPRLLVVIVVTYFYIL